MFFHSPQQRGRTLTKGMLQDQQTDFNVQQKWLVAPGAPPAEFELGTGNWQLGT
jgi:hypothetical protein